MRSWLEQMIGPRVPAEEWAQRRWRYLVPGALFLVARVLLIVSVFLPWWHMELDAPQYPQGLYLTAYLNHLAGDVREINSLNHYIGMRPLEEAARFERAWAAWGVIAMLFLVEGAAVVHTRWAVLLALPAILFPAGFLIDLKFWLTAFGQNLDPAAPLSRSVRPFTPTILGEGGVGQFATYAWLGAGWWSALGCSILTVAGFVFHRWAYKPLVDSQRRALGQGGGDSAAGVRSGTRLRQTAIVAGLAGAAGAWSPQARADSIAALMAAAPDGGTVVVPAGVYRERVRVDRTLTLEAQGHVVIDGGGGGDVVEILAPGVVLRGFVVRGTGTDLDRENAAVRVLAPQAVIERNVIEDALFGVDLRGAPGSVVRGNCIGGKRLGVSRRGDVLRLWRCDGTVIEGNVFEDGRDAIVWYSADVRIAGNVARACRYGLHLMFADQVTIEGNELTGNSVGVYAMYSRGLAVRGNRFVRNRGPSGYGLGLKEADQFVVEENVFVGNRAGTYLDGSPFSPQGTGRFRRNTFAFNDVGMLFLPSVRGNEVVENNFVENLEQVAVAGRGDARGNRFWDGERGNFWSNYTGYDGDGDGIGDFVHEPGTLFENLMAREPGLRLFLFGPAQRAVEFVARAVPVIRPAPILEDEAPLIRPVAWPETGAGAWSGGGSEGRGLAPAGAGLLTIAAVLLVLGRGRA